MNIITETDKVFRAISEIEGERWVKQESEDSPYNKGDTHFYGVYNELKEMIEINGEPLEKLSVDIHWEIYGDGGWNRYPVRCNGEVLFSAYHCPSEKMIEKAKDLGFSIAR